jgi:hypothetical protein
MFSLSFTRKAPTQIDLIASLRSAAQTGEDKTTQDNQAL